jgi:ZIP family zinc transporter
VGSQRCFSAPGPAFISSVQHFAAGVVFAAPAAEILPDLQYPGSTLPLALGGALGVVIMMVMNLKSRWKVRSDWSRQLESIF